MQSLSITALLVLFAAPSLAQSVATTIVGSAMTVGATGPFGIVQSTTQPAGVLPPFGPFLLSPFGGMSTINWTTTGDASTGTTIVLSHSLFASNAAHFANGTFTIEYVASATVTALLTVSGLPTGTAGAAIPGASVDVGADGSIEIPFALALQGQVTFPLVLTAGVPMRVAIAMNSALAGPVGSLGGEVTITLGPDRDLGILRNAIGCESPSTPFFARPSFADRGLDLGYPSGAPLFFVLGLAMQPIVLPSVAATPCLLVPRPDIVFFSPTGLQHVALPAAVRPVDFFAQGVAWNGIALFPTDGYWITAP